MTPDYEVLSVSRTYRAMAARHAVLRPILNVGTITPDDVPKLLRDLRHLWCHRVEVFATAGWTRVQTPVRVVVLQDCPPFGVMTRRRGRACRIAQACPFCSARQRVLDPFIGFEYLCYGPDLDRRRAPPGWSLVEFDTRVAWPRLKLRLRDTVFPHIAAHRREEVDALDPVGALVMHTLEVTDDALILHRRGLAVVERGQFPATRERKVRHHDSRARPSSTRWAASAATPIGCSPAPRTGPSPS